MSLDYSPELLRQHSHYKAIRERLDGSPRRVAPPEIKLVEKPPVVLEIPHTREWLFVASQPETEITHLWVSDICREVRQQFQVTRADFESPRRHVGIVEPRQVAMALAKRLTKRSLPEIGRQFGGRDHTTVLHAIRKYEPVLAEVEKTVTDGAPISAWVAAFKEQMTITPAANGRVSARKNHVKRQPKILQRPSCRA